MQETATKKDSIFKNKTEPQIVLSYKVSIFYLFFFKLILTKQGEWPVAQTCRDKTYTVYQTMLD